LKSKTRGSHKGKTGSVSAGARKERDREKESEGVRCWKSHAESQQMGLKNQKKQQKQKGKKQWNDEPGTKIDKELLTREMFGERETNVRKIEDEKEEEMQKKKKKLGSGITKAER